MYIFSAFEELQKTLDNIVSDPFASKYQNKIILCAKAMLSKATKVSVSYSQLLLAKIPSYT